MPISDTQYETTDSWTSTQQAPTSRLDTGPPARTKIIATLGPATQDPEIIEKMIEAGASVFRLNFSHGSLGEHEAVVHAVRRAAARFDWPIAILGDLPGQKIRVANVPEHGIEIVKGATVRFVRERITAVPARNGEPAMFSSTYPRLIDDVQPGERVLIDDGNVRLLVVDCEPDSIECTVTQSGLVTTGKGINLPDSTLTAESPAENDWPFVEWAIRNDIDVLAMSFVRDAGDVRRLREGIEQRKQKLKRPEFRLPIIAKIELPAAVTNIDAIVDAADAIMIARGDLGVEMDLTRVPVIQKQLMTVAQQYGKPSIVATQMFQSMIHAPVPTRAEVSDVAGAIFEDADAVMLSGETAIGNYPVLVVDYMRRVNEHTEAYRAAQPPRPTPPAKLVQSQYRTAALAHGVWTTAQDFGARLIVVWSEHGGGARYLSKHNFNIPIVAISSDERITRQMQLLRGVVPVRMDPPGGAAAFTQAVNQYLQEGGWVKAGDRCVLVAGHPIGQSGVTNSLALHTIGKTSSGAFFEPD